MYVECCLRIIIVFWVLLLEVHLEIPSPGTRFWELRTTGFCVDDFFSSGRTMIEVYSIYHLETQMRPLVSLSKQIKVRVVRVLVYDTWGTAGGCRYFGTSFGRTNLLCEKSHYCTRVSDPKIAWIYCSRGEHAFGVTLA